NVYDIRNWLKLFFELPVFDGFEFHQVVLGIGTFQRVPVNLTDWTPVGAHLRLQTVGKSNLREPLQNLGPVPIVIGTVVENQHHAGQAEKRIGAEMGQQRQTVHLDFDRGGDL